MTSAMGDGIGGAGGDRPCSGEWSAGGAAETYTLDDRLGEKRPSWGIGAMYIATRARWDRLLGFESWALRIGLVNGLCHGP